MKGVKPMRTGTVEAVALSLLFLTSASCAGWRDDAAPRDIERLSHLTEARQKGLDEAASVPDFAAIRSIVQAGTVAASSDRLAGTWRCRTMKLGGLTPAIIYSWFRCRISERGGRLFFEKLGGSQRTSGWLYSEGEGFVYLGASYVHYNGTNEKPHAYSGSGAAAGASATPDDQIGMLSLTCDGRVWSCPIRCRNPPST